MTVKHTYTLNASVETSTGIDIGIGGTPTLVQDEDVDLEYQIHETTDHETPVNISGASEIEWVATAADGSEQLTKTLSGDISIVSNGSGGKVSVPIAASDTSNLTAQTTESQLTVRDDGSGNRTVAARGEFSITSNYS